MPKLFKDGTQWAMPKLFQEGEQWAVEAPNEKYIAIAHLLNYIEDKGTAPQELVDKIIKHNT